MEGREGKAGKTGAREAAGREGEGDPLVQMKLHAGLVSYPSPPRSDREGASGAS